MNAVTNKVEKKEAAPIVVFRNQLEARLDSFAEALPPHISPALFKSTLLSSVMADPNLLGADRISLFEAAKNAANDGLLPDKKEGAMVIYFTKIKDGSKDIWIKKVQWMPMIRGILTKLYNTGKVKSATVGIVYAGDDFRAWTDDAGEHLFHEEGDQQDRSVVRRVYAQVVMAAGGVFVETMRIDDLDKIRNASKSKDSGPWRDWPEEMWKKSVFRRLAKRLPMSREIMPLLERDDFLYQMDDRPAISDTRRPAGSLTARLDEATGAVGRIDHTPQHDDDGVILDNDSLSTNKPASTRNHAKDTQDADSPSSPKEGDQAAGSTPPSQESAADESSDDAKAYRAGREAKAKGIARKAIPAVISNDPALKQAWLEGYDDGAEKQSEG
ncbi:hypothetical protein GA830_10300 [Mesorhizobium sp. NBSH29]|uniref:RecT family recombinase n=1 Tax=Mesorhizobium sp. NBSH29 TaxID=2654249 RepID=UPI0018969732|nr:RecT family recombinase [Mesorhizobium sp. NBSH29]QPC87086.1 hypothetical protein GA830_10300 [Mesorhizobium sp. NBSH29]